MLSSYTWSRSMDHSSGIRVQGGDTLFPQSSYCMKCEWAASSFDTRHRFVTSALYDLPIGKGRRVGVANPVLNVLVGGWQIGGVWTVQSGFPITPSVGRGPARHRCLFRSSKYHQGFTLSRRPAPLPLVEFGGVYAQHPRDSRHRRPQLTGQPGNIGAGWLLDKEFRMSYAEGRTLQFRFEAFNLLNHAVWGNPNTNVLSSGFGTITGTRFPMRQVQLALKYKF